MYFDEFLPRFAIVLLMFLKPVAENDDKVAESRQGLVPEIGGVASLTNPHTLVQLRSEEAFGTLGFCSSA